MTGASSCRRKTGFIEIRNGLIVDGSGDNPIKGDVLIEGHKIAAVGAIPEGVTSGTVIDASGMAISPGFIDSHSHSDVIYLVHPDANMKIMQGVTTEIVGNCGYSAAPLVGESVEHVSRSTPSFNEPALEWTWRSMDQYIARLKIAGLPNNVVAMVGHGTLRANVMGNVNRKANLTEIAEMKRLLGESLERGAAGLTAGLLYPPGCYAGIDELEELCKIVAYFGKVFACHMRNYGPGLVKSVQEMLHIGRATGVSIQISHLMAAGRDSWNAVDVVLELLDKARAEGINVNFDQYPYNASMTTLRSLLPRRLLEGGSNQLLQRFDAPTCRAEIAEELSKPWVEEENIGLQAGWENIRVICHRENKFEGYSVQELASFCDCTPEEMVIALIREDVDATMQMHWVQWQDVITLARHPLQMVGSDSGKGGQGSHPRTYGTFPKILGEFVRERRAMSLEEAVRKMTAVPAQKFGLRNRGELKEGYVADLVVFDPLKVKDRASYQEAERHPTGIEYVFLGGKLVVRNGKFLGYTEGTVLV